MSHTSRGAVQNGYVAINAGPAPATPPSAEPCCPRRHSITIFGFCACFVMEVSRTFSVVVIPMSQEFGWDDKVIGVVRHCPRPHCPRPHCLPTPPLYPARMAVPPLPECAP